ncbi:MAG: hypothetical protein PUA52_01010 [Lachnospiraceae bacterium]|nr:hypothetical protein [Lachnospiraceae bacterium]
MKDYIFVKMKKRLTAAVMAAVLFVLCCVNVEADTQSDIDSARKAQSDAESSLTETNDRLASMRSEKDELEDYLNELNARLDELSASLDSLNRQIEDKNLEIEMAKAAIERAHNDEENQHNDMQTRIRYMYENSSGFVESLFSSRSLSDFLNRADEISQIQNYDRVKMEDYKAACAVVEQKEAELEEEEKALVALKADAEAQLAAVRELADQTDAKIEACAGAISESEAEASKLRQLIDSQKAKLESLRVKAEQEAEARRAAEEAAAKAAALAAENAVQNAGQGSSGNTPEDAGNSPSGTNSRLLGHFMLTAYCNCAKCCGRAGAPTASGVMPTESHTIAMGGVPFGTRLMINGVVYTVEDRGTPYGHVDIYMESHSACLQFGLRYADVYILE